MSINVQFERLHDDVENEDVYEKHNFMPTTSQGFPKAIGVVQIISGFIIAFLGTMEVMIVPILADKPGENYITLDKRNCFGAGIMAGLLMVITGSTAIRATISNRKTTVARFYNLSIITFVFYMAITILLMLGYSLGWTTADKYVPGSRVREVHIFVTIFSLLGLLFALTALVKYYDIVFSDKVKLGERWLACILCCLPYKKRETKAQAATPRNYFM